ncbi:branched-chain amino acid ABC transporter permease [Halorubrum ruber]|uniref:Branched-chain amino acid ABC transporter permease n=1 Tax=Halorubrum ruber TaxID=2982524 RepID=A0A8T8LQ60_9EURY|nr:branched-chain amino acid ABC transporter permease [Halorubrum ruber]
MRDHAVHAAVIVGFLLYPLVYEALLATPAATLAEAFLPAVTFMIAVLYMGLFAMSFDFVSGYTGYLSFGHAAFYGTGAYFVVLAANGQVPGIPAGTPFMITLLLGAVLAGLLAIVIGSVSFRLTGVYFAMITLGFAQVIYELIRSWGYVSSNPTEGTTVSGDALAVGVPYIDALSLNLGRLTGESVENLLGLGIDLSATVVSYYALGIVVVVCYFAMQRIVHSPFGRVMVAIRENEERARAVGYPTYRFKLAAFAISGFFGAIAGGVFAAYSRSVAPDGTFYFLVTADALITTIIGGFGTLAGPVYGTLFTQGLEDVLSTESGGIATLLREGIPEGVYETDLFGVSLELFVNTAVDGRAPLYLGIIFVLFVLFVPNGILGTLRDRLGGTVGKRLPDHLRRYLR